MDCMTIQINYISFFQGAMWHFFINLFMDDLQWCNACCCFYCIISSFFSICFHRIKLLEPKLLQHNCKITLENTWMLHYLRTQFLWRFWPLNVRQLQMGINTVRVAFTILTLYDELSHPLYTWPVPAEMSIHQWTFFFLIMWFQKLKLPFNI